STTFELRTATLATCVPLTPFERISARPQMKTWLDVLVRLHPVGLWNRSHVSSQRAEIPRCPSKSVCIVSGDFPDPFRSATPNDHTGSLRQLSAHRRSATRKF